MPKQSVYQIAFYHGPSSTVKGWLSDILVSIGTMSPITHVELVIDGMCYSSSGLDGGVRVKKIDLNDGKWEVIHITVKHPLAMWAFINRTLGAEYDFAGIVRFALPFVKSDPDKWFCSEWVAQAIGDPVVADKVTPKDLYKWVTKK